MMCNYKKGKEFRAAYISKKKNELSEPLFLNLSKLCKLRRCYIALYSQSQAKTPHPLST